MKKSLLTILAFLFCITSAWAQPSSSPFGPTPPDNTPYNATTWDNSWLAPTQNSVRDQIELMLGGGIDHGTLSGLADDDHPHYFLADGSRDLSGTLVPSADNTWDLGQALIRRFRNLSLSGTATAPIYAAGIPAVQSGSYAIHHGGIVIWWDSGNDTSVQVGPVDDGTTTLPFTGAIRVPTIYGSSASGGDTVIESTSHATKGDVLLNPNGGNVGIGTDIPNLMSGLVNGTFLTIYDATYRGFLELGTDTSVDNAVIGSVYFSNNNNSNAGASTYKRAAHISALSETTDGNADDDSGAHIVIYTKPESGTSAEGFRVSSTGEVKAPKSPAFGTTMSADQGAFTIDTTHTIAFDTERFDQASNFNNATYIFTAPVTGLYQFNVSIRLENLDSASTGYDLQLVTSNYTYKQTLDVDQFAGDLTYFPMSMPILADMDAADTAYVTIYQGGGAQQTKVDKESYFSGRLTN